MFYWYTDPSAGLSFSEVVCAIIHTLYMPAITKILEIVVLQRLKTHAKDESIYMVLFQANPLLFLFFKKKFLMVFLGLVKPLGGKTAGCHFDMFSFH